MNYERKTKEKAPIIAICYDFDKTLSPNDMQAQGYIRSVGWDAAEFRKKSNDLALSSGMDQNRAYMYVIDYFAPADYSAESAFDKLVRAIIDRHAVGGALEAWHDEMLREQQRCDDGRSEADRRRVDLIIALENSHSFADTHSIVRELQKREISSPQERELLFGAALKNNQVRLVLGDADVRRFYAGLLGNMKTSSESSQARQQLLAQSGEEQ